MSRGGTIQLVGGLLLVSGLLGLGYSIRVARSQWLYFVGKYGPSVDADFPQRVALAEAAYRLYPHNYHMSLWVSEEAWYEEGDEVVASRWVSRGLRRNPHQLELRWLESILLGQEDPALAAAVWERYSDRVFWHSWVLAGRVYWYAMAGRLAEAEIYLVMLRGRPHHAWAAESVRAAHAISYR